MMVLAAAFGLCALPKESTRLAKSAKELQAAATRQTRTYMNDQWGVSFEYPANYTFREWNAPVKGFEPFGPGQMSDGHPGRILLASVMLPASLFPATDLDSARFAVYVNPNLTREECRAAAAVRKGDPTNAVELGGVSLDWSQDGFAVPPIDITQYTGFSAGTCYEMEWAYFRTRHGPPPGATRVNPAELDRLRDELLRTVRFWPHDGPANLPKIRSLGVEALPPPAPPNTYRVSWAVQDAEVKQVTLDLDCWADESILEMTTAARDQTPVPCGELIPVHSLEGFWDLEFHNYTGAPRQPHVRLCAQGREPAAISATFSVQALPVILMMGQSPVIFTKGVAAGIFAGRKAELSGLAFTQNETIWIGNTSVQASSYNGRELEFEVPASIAQGIYPIYVQDARGRSNRVDVQVIRPAQPGVSGVNEYRIPRDTEITIVAGKRVQVIGFGFTLRNTVWIGSVSVTADSDERLGMYVLHFTVPAGIKPGVYSLHVANELGTSNEVTVTVAAAE